MAFWSDKTLRSRLSSVIIPSHLSKVDTSGYRLSVGEKVYVTKDLDSSNHPTNIDLDIRSGIQIPPGQFALISTKEKIIVPQNAMGFISIRAKIKFKGLINVSGFHVDPGYSDHLIFSVFNAGPKAIPIQKDDDIFLIWFADLDQENDVSKGGGKLNGNIPSDFIGEVNLQVNSTAALSDKFKNFERQFIQIENQVNSTATLSSEFKSFEQQVYKWVYPLLIAAVTTLIGVGSWGFLNVYELNIQSKVLQKSIENQDTDINKSLDNLNAQYKLLKLSIDEQKSSETQKKVIESLNQRLIDIEKKLSTQTQKK